MLVPLLHLLCSHYVELSMTSCHWHLLGAPRQHGWLPNCHHCINQLTSCLLGLLHRTKPTIWAYWTKPSFLSISSTTRVNFMRVYKCNTLQHVCAKTIVYLQPRQSLANTPTMLANLRWTPWQLYQEVTKLWLWHLHSHARIATKPQPLIWLLESPFIHHFIDAQQLSRIWFQVLTHACKFLCPP